MKISTINPQFAPVLRAVAEDTHTVAAIANASVQTPLTGIGSLTSLASLNIGTTQFSLLNQLPLGAKVDLNPILPPCPAPQPTADAASARQYEELKVLARDVMLPMIKTIWPDASNVVTGVQVVWAGKEFWDLARDKNSDATKKKLAGVRLASNVAGLLLSVEDAPKLAINTNLIAGFVISGADKVYSVRLDSLTNKSS